MFLDRDGTLNVKASEGEYIRTPEELALLPGVAAGIRRLNEAGVRLVLVSNQRGVARGQMTAADLAAVDRRLTESLAEHGGHIDATYYCVHEAGTCDCRKPLPGLLLKAVQDDPDIDLRSSVLIGDAESDVQAAVAAGVPAVRIAGTAVAPVPTKAVRTVSDFAAAVEFVLQESG